MIEARELTKSKRNEFLSRIGEDVYFENVVRAIVRQENDGKQVKYVCGVT